MDIDRTFGPVFNESSFLLPLLSLQQAIEGLKSEPNGHQLKDVCNQPLHGDKACNIQNLWAYWQDSPSNLAITKWDDSLQRELSYLDHFLACDNNPTLDGNSDKTQRLPCMSKGIQKIKHTPQKWKIHSFVQFLFRRHPGASVLHSRRVYA